MALSLAALAVGGLVACETTADRADLNGDGYVDVLDMTLVATCIALELTSADPRCVRADVDRSGTIDELVTSVDAASLASAGFPADVDDQSSFVYIIE